MNFYEVVEKRKTIRKYSNKPIPQETMRKILNSGLMAPTHDHKRNWEFILVKDINKRMEIIEMAEKIIDALSPEEIENSKKSNEDYDTQMYLEAVPLQKKMILTAPEVLIVCYKTKNTIEECKNIYQLNDFASAWCCIENILLSMAAEDIFGVTYIPQNTVKIRSILDIPDNYEIPVIIPMGYLDVDSGRCKQNSINLDDRIHINQW